MDIKEKQHAVLLNAIIGATLASPFEGMSKGHISSTFKVVEDYTDPLPGLKGKYEQWRKPGFYPSCVQIMLIIAMLKGTRGEVGEELIDRISIVPEVVDYDYKIFRHPGRIERAFLQRIKDNSEEIMDFPATELIPLIIPQSLDKRNMLDRTTGYIRLLMKFTRHAQTIAGCVITGFILNHFIYHGIQTGFWDDILAVIKNISQLTGERPDLIFDLGLNPETFIQAINRYEGIITAIAGKKPEIGEKLIYEELNRSLKTPLTRATINDPLAIIPYALVLYDCYKDLKDDLGFHIIKEGGAVTVLALLVNALAAAISGSRAIAEILATNLVNKKRIFAIIEAVISGKRGDGLLPEFIQGEVGLTTKEHAELLAKLKHVAPQKKKQKTRREKELDMARHVVESWTKLDKARWKKEKRKIKDEPEFDLEES